MSPARQGGTGATLRSALPRLAPGEPAQRFLYIKMTRVDWSDGALMPEDGVPRAADQALVRD